MEVFLVLYLTIGFIYATYILLFTEHLWYWFPLNLVLGPVTLIYNLYIVAKIEREKFNKVSRFF